MKRIDILSQDTNFIGCWNINDDKLCKQIIYFFNNNTSLQTQGKVGVGKDLKIKNSIDITINPKDLEKSEYQIFKKYFEQLHKCYLDYLNQWPNLEKMIKDLDIGQFNIQKYNQGGHFAGVHSERTSIKTVHRVFAWMTYLNDVNDGGSTNFAHFNIDIKPEIGKTMIWPAEWTHAHSGKIVNSEEKYIITGWMHFPSD